MIDRALSSALTMADAVIVLQAESQQRHHTARGPGDEQQVSFQPQPTLLERISSEPDGAQH